MARPAARVATVTAHVREPNGTTVRGVGSVQVSYGLWLRDWALTRVFDVISAVAVSSRIGSLMRRGVINGVFQQVEVTKGLPRILQTINDDTQQLLKQSLFTDVGAAAQGGGAVGQAIAEAATAAVGARTERAINQQIDQFVETKDVQLEPDAAEEARAAITQASSTLQAGFTQSSKQLFTTPPVGA